MQAEGKKSTLKRVLGIGYPKYQTWAGANSFFESQGVKDLIRLADFLQVTVDQLFEVHSTSELEDGDHPQGISKYHNPGNCLYNYKIRHGLTHKQLAKRLGGITTQYAQYLCSQPYALKGGIARICVYEGMSKEEFLAIYGGNGVEEEAG